jgi:hypothetical protein
MKPKLLYDVLRQSSPRKIIGNRYAVLRDSSPADSVRSDASFRPRSQSVKRNLTGDIVNQVSYSDVVLSQSRSDLPIEEMNTNIAKVKSICETVTTEIGASSLDPAAITILSLLNNAISSLCENQQKLINSKQVTQPPPAMVDTAGSQKRPRHEYSDTNMVDFRSVSQTRTSRAPPPRIEVNPEVKKFKDTVREAENLPWFLTSTLADLPSSTMILYQQG